MLQLTVITVGNLKESYWRDAVSEYEKRLSAFCKPNIIQLKETKLPEDPAESEIAAALADEGLNIENMTNKSKGDNAYTVVDVATAPSAEAVARIAAGEGIYKVRAI